LAGSVKTYGAPPLGSAPQRKTRCATTGSQKKKASHRKAQKAQKNLARLFVRRWITCRR